MKNLLFICIIMLLLSCETTIDPELPGNGSGIVVYSFFRPGSPLRLDVFNTTPILQAETIQRKKDLRIKVLENDKFVEEVTANAQGFYNSTIVPSETSTYSFEATAGNTKLFATSHIPEAVEISDASVSEEIQYINSGKYGYPAKLSLTDPERTINFYSLEVLIENCSGGGCAEENLEGTLNELLVEELKVNTSGNTDIEIIGGPQQIDGLKNIYFSDEGFNGESVEFEFFIVPTLIDFNKDQNIKLVLKTITKEYHQYLRTSDFQKAQEEEGNLSEPVQIATNIANGIGTFAGYNYSIYTINH